MKGLCVLLLAASCCTAVAMRAAPAAREGDLIFHTSRSAQSVAVQRATRSKYSHMGMILLKDGKLQVFEAVSPVKYTPLPAWIARGEGRHFVLKRLRDADAVLTPKALARMRATAATFAGRPYDLTFEWSDQRMYCSEVVWKVFDRVLGKRIGQLQAVGSFDLTDPAVKTKMRERYGDRVPLDEPAISPGAMFDSPMLVTVAEG